MLYEVGSVFYFSSGLLEVGISVIDLSEFLDD